jgi:hypothetical protein
MSSMSLSGQKHIWAAPYCPRIFGWKCAAVIALAQGFKRSASEGRSVGEASSARDATDGRSANPYSTRDL